MNFFKLWVLWVPDPPTLALEKQGQPCKKQGLLSLWGTPKSLETKAKTHKKENEKARLEGEGQVHVTQATSDKASLPDFLFFFRFSRADRPHGPQFFLFFSVAFMLFYSCAECTKIARFSAAAAAIFTAPQKIARFLEAPRCAISSAKKIASEPRFLLRRKWVKMVLAAEFPAIPSSAVKIASEWRCAILVHSAPVFCSVPGVDPHVPHLLWIEYEENWDDWLCQGQHGFGEPKNYYIPYASWGPTFWPLKNSARAVTIKPVRETIASKGVFDN